MLTRRGSKHGVQRSRGLRGLHALISEDRRFESHASQECQKKTLRFRDPDRRRLLLCVFSWRWADKLVLWSELHEQDLEVTNILAVRTIGNERCRVQSHRRLTSSCRRQQFYRNGNRRGIQRTRRHAPYESIRFLAGIGVAPDNAKCPERVRTAALGSRTLT